MTKINKLYKDFRENNILYIADFLVFRFLDFLFAQEIFCAWNLNMLSYLNKLSLVVTNAKHNIVFHFYNFRKKQRNAVL